MSTPGRAFAGARIFDGVRLLSDHVLLENADGSTKVTSHDALPDGCPVTQLGGGIITQGMVDLQVNGGGGVMFNHAPKVDTLAQIAAAHRGLGSLALLPTLITDTPENTRAAITAIRAAQDQRLQGITGLHLEGPHLSRARKGAHDGALIRPMEEADLAAILDAANAIDTVMVTVAPENVTIDQITQMTREGIVVSLGHSDCDYDTAMRAFDAGARCATHLYNAMSQASSRAPGLVGAALDHGAAFSGLIADGIHVHPAMIRSALAAKRGPGKIFLVSDAMATAGSDITSFTLNEREILRKDGRLTLKDGTLAGADLTLPQAVAYLVNAVGVPLADALAMASSVPAGLLRQNSSLDRIGDLVWFSDASEDQDAEFALTHPRWLSDV